MSVIFCGSEISSCSSIALKRYLSPVPCTALVSTISSPSFTSRIFSLKTSFSAWETRSVLVTTAISARASIALILRGVFTPDIELRTTIPSDWVVYGEQRRHSPALSTSRRSAPSDSAHDIASLMTSIPTWSGQTSPEYTFFVGIPNSSASSSSSKALTTSIFRYAHRFSPEYFLITCLTTAVFPADGGPAITISFMPDLRS